MRRFVRLLFLTLDALVVLLFALGYAAAYVPPRVGWLLELVGVGLPYLAMWIVAATAVLAWMRRWPHVALHAALLVLIAVRFLPPGGWPDPGTPRPGDLTLMTYNVPSTRDSREQASRLRRLAQRVDPEIIALQETLTRYRRGAGFPISSADMQVVGLIDTLRYAPAPLDPAERRQRTRGLNVTQLVLSRGVPMEMTYRRLETDDPENRQTHVARVRFRWQGREAVLYNVHLRSYGMAKPWQENGEEALDSGFWERYLLQYREAIRLRGQEVRQLRRMIEQETLPVIVAGDLNSTMHSWAYRTLSEGLQDAFRQTGLEWGATYHARMPLVRIDFVLASPEWEVVASTVPDVTFSDHRPLVVTLRWRSSGKGE